MQRLNALESLGTWHHAARFETPEVGWVLISTALVLLMTPGLAFFYGGLVRARNIVSTIMYSFIAMAVVSVGWVLWGYTFALEPLNPPEIKNWKSYGDLRDIGFTLIVKL